MKKAIILIILISFFVSVVVLFERGNSITKSEQPSIVVTNFPLYEIAKKIVGTDVVVKKLIPFGVEAHSFRPSPQTIVEISKAKIFFYSGLGMEPWIKTRYRNAIDMSKYAQLLSIDANAQDIYDPHYWLDIENMKSMTKETAIILSKKFPDKKDKFEANAKSYIKQLSILEKSYRKELKVCRLRKIVLNHNAFNYLAKRFNFHSYGVTGLSPDEQVGAKKMKQIVEFIKKEKIQVIFFESFISPKIAKTISKEVGVKVDSLQPLANVTKDEAQRGYISLMYDNLKKIKSAMECR